MTIQIPAKVIPTAGDSEKDTEFIEDNISWNPRKTTNIEVRTVDSKGAEPSGKKRYLINRLNNRLPMKE